MSDLSGYSDEELQAIVGIKPKVDLSGYSDDELMKTVGIPQKADSNPTENTGFISGVKNAYNGRIQEGQKAADRYVSGKQGALSTGLQLGAKIGLGVPQDIGTEVLSHITPQFVKDAAGNVVNYLGNTGPGRVVAGAAGNVSKAYGNFAQNHPEAAANIESVADIGAMLPIGKILSVSAPIVADTTSAVAKGSLKTAGKTAGAVGSGIGKVVDAVTPGADEGLKNVAQLARTYDIPLSLDQITNSRALKNVQKVSQELPMSGQAAFRDKQMSAWNKQLLNTVGIEGDKFTKMNMDKAFINVGREFDNLGAGKTFSLDDSFARRLDEIRQDAAMTATSDSIGNFNNMASKVLKEAGPNGEISGEKLGTLRSEINRLARKSNNPDTQDLLHDLENAVIDTMTAGDDAANQAFSATKQKYKNLLVLEPLANKAKGGNFSPSLLNDRVSKIYGRSFSRGKAGPIGDLAQIGHELLPELGGSDTMQKMMYGIGATGGAITHAPATASALTANRLFQSALNRNQGLVNRKLSISDIMKLPPAEARALLEKQK